MLGWDRVGPKDTGQGGDSCGPAARVDLRPKGGGQKRQKKKKQAKAPSKVETCLNYPYKPD